MFRRLRVEDRQLFEQLAHITEHLARSARLLERLLDAPRSASAGIASESRSDIAPATDERATDVRAFTGFAMRLDRMEYRELAQALDAALAAVRDATEQADSLDASGAPRGIRSLASLLSGAAITLHGAVPYVRVGGGEIARRTAALERLVHEGEGVYYAGVGVLFDGTPDAVHVLRWKAIYDAVQHGLASCGRCGALLAQLTGAMA